MTNVDSTTLGPLVSENRASLSETPHYSFENPTSNAVPPLTIEDRPKSSTSFYFHPAANMAARPNNDAPIPPEDNDGPAPPGGLQDPEAEAPEAEDAANAAAQLPALPDYGTLTAAQIVLINQGTPSQYADKASVSLEMAYKKETPAAVAGTRRQGTLGLWRDTSREVREVQVVEGSPYVFPFNDEGNTYAINVAARCSVRLHALVTRDGRGRGILPEKTAFLQVIQQEQDDLCDRAGFERETQHKRTAMTLWRIWQGFCSSEPQNPQLEDILIFYAQIRLGLIKHDADEYKAMVYACNHYMASFEGGDPRPLEVWTLPAIHALHFHMKLYYTGRLRPLLFADTLLQHQELTIARALTSKTITYQEAPEEEEAGAKRKRDDEDDDTPITHRYQVAKIPNDIHNFREFLIHHSYGHLVATPTPAEQLPAGHTEVPDAAAL